MSYFANRDRSSRKDLNYTMVRFPPTSHPDVRRSDSLQIQGFEWYTEGGGVHWKKLTSLIPSLSEMGITAIWIPRSSLPVTQRRSDQANLSIFIPAPTKAASSEVFPETCSLFDWCLTCRSVEECRL